MNKSVFKYVSFLSCFLLFYSVNGQEHAFENEFKLLDASGKIAQYENLNDSIKKANADFLKQQFEELVTDSTINNLGKKTKFIVAQLNFYTGNYIESVNLFKDLIDQDEYDLTQKDSMHVYDELKKSYYKLYLYSEVFEVNSKIKQLINNGATYPLWSYNMDSFLYARLQQFDKAIIALKLEIKKLKESHETDPLIIPSAYNDLGYYFFESKLNDSALVNFKKSLKYADKWLKGVNKQSYEQLVGVVKGNIAAVYVQRKNFTEAIDYLKEDVEVGVRTKAYIESTLHSYSLLVKCYVELGMYDKALKAINDVENYVPSLQDRESSVDYYVSKSDYYKHVNQLDSAYHYLTKAYKVKDYISTRGIHGMLESNELMHSITEKEKLLKQYQVDLKNQELTLKNTQKNILIFFTSLLLLLLGLSSYHVFKLKKSKKEIRLKNNQILNKNKKIKEALEEKEVLLKEVHHRVKNNLQVISGLLELQNITVSDDSVKLALKEGQNRIQSVALVHKMMYQSASVSKVNMEKYLKELLQVLQSSYGISGKMIKTEISASNIDLDVTLAVPLSLIVNEAVCNAYKHAFVTLNEGNIFVGIEIENDTTYTLTVKDNGIGLPSNFNTTKLKSIGFDLIKGLTKQLKGRLDVNTDEGTEIIITFLNNAY